MMAKQTRTAKRGADSNDHSLLSNYHSAASRLAAAEERYATLVQTIPDIIFEVNASGHFTFVNNAVRDMGFEPKELIGKHFKAIVHPDDVEKVSRAIILPKYRGLITGDEASPKLFDERRTEKRMTKNLVLRLVRKDDKGKLIYAEMSSSGKWNVPSNFRKKRLIGSIGIIRDISQRKKAEEDVAAAKHELEDTNKELKKFDQLKSDFVSIVSHELRTPLSTTKEGINLILDGIAGDISSKQRHILGTSKKNIERLERIINELLDLSKIEAGRLELNRKIINIVDVARHSFESFEPKAMAKGLELKLNISGKNAQTYADEDKLQQVFTNLVGNSLKFTQEGFVEISVHDTPRHIECAVIDTGIGIPKKDLPKVFDKFHQAVATPDGAEKGTGLGLSIAKKLVELHGGRIEVTSEPGKGTKITFTLPKYDAQSIAREYLDAKLREAREKGLALSVITAHVAPQFLEQAEEAIKEQLRRKEDSAVRCEKDVVIILPGCNKEGIAKVAKRMKEGLLKKFESESPKKEIQISVRSATFDGNIESSVDLIKKARGGEHVI